MSNQPAAIRLLVVAMNMWLATTGSGTRLTSADVMVTQMRDPGTGREALCLMFEVESGAASGHARPFTTMEQAR